MISLEGGQAGYHGVPKALFENKKKDCAKCTLIGEAINLAKEDATYYPDKEYGDRLLISTTAQKEDEKDNLRVAKAILDSFPQKKIRIRPHINSAGVKNTELMIDNLIADNKKIEGEKDITSGFKKLPIRDAKW